VRFALLILFATILIHTTSPSELNMALAYFLRPLGRHGADVAFMVRVAMAFIPGLMRDKETILRAQTARGYKPKGLTGFTATMVPLLRKSFRKADELADALESRCYHQDRECYYYNRALIGRDWILIGIFAGVLVLFYFCTGTRDSIHLRFFHKKSSKNCPPGWKSVFDRSLVNSLRVRYALRVGLAIYFFISPKFKRCPKNQ